MEPNQENYNDAITSTTTVEEQHQQSLRYNCTFCTSRFTNPQALGGHMQIHRMHKAMPTFSPPPNVAATNVAINPFSIYAKGKNKSRQFFGDGSHDSRNNHQENVMRDPISPGNEVDLELRLGQSESSGSKITTRKFF
ncbi:unnamed protein product [Lactuca saligna]|uniref:C2H2-type domain-containing protein n=1 Tax=Lactuca saligna TaxID=75948 RepID=A0AA36EMB5_LACSI|nr:unnamed protein product [Lactuca saligna]